MHRPSQWPGVAILAILNTMLAESKHGVAFARSAHMIQADHPGLAMSLGLGSIVFPAEEKDCRLVVEGSQKDLLLG